MSEQLQPCDDSGQTAPSDLGKQVRAVAAVEHFLGLDQALDSMTPRNSRPSPGAPTECTGTREVPADHAASAPPGYEILAELGRGGMGVVYKARHLRLSRVVALKMILAGGHAAVSERLRFLGEAEVVASLQHANIVSLLEYGEHQGLPFFTLEFMPGGSLAHRLDGVPQPAREAARLIEQLARAIHYAHTRGIVHRDIKPGNILLAEDGTPKITDFGLARRGEPGSGLTATGEVLGTPSYMAPEQAGGKTKDAGPAADIYALGAILYECLTGRPPFRAANTVETVLQVVNQEAVSVRQVQPHTPVDLATVCHKCLQKEPNKRYASAQELAEDCVAFLEGKPIRARPVGKLERGWRWCRRNPALAGALAVVVVSLLVGSTISLVFGFRAEAARHSEELRAEGEARAKGEADQARRDAQRQLVDLCVASGTTAARDGDHALALLWFARAAHLAGDDPKQEQLNRIRVANWLRQVWLPEGTFAIPGFRENQDRFRQLQFSPDGNYLLVVASTGDCLVWDRRQGQLSSLPGAAAKGTAATWQPRSNVLAVAEPLGRIRLFAVPDFRPVGEVAASGEITVMAFSRDGKRLAWGGSDGARVWDREKQQYLTPLLPHGGRVIALSFSAAGALLATADNRNKARVFRVPSSGIEPLFPPVLHAQPEDVYAHGGADRVAPRFADADKAVLTVEGNGGHMSVLMWRSSTTGEVLGSSADGAAFAVNDQGTQVAANTGARGRLLDAQSREVLAPIQVSASGSWTEHTLFSADGQTVVTCGSDTTARFWSTDEDRPGAVLSESHPSIHHPMRAVRVSLTANSRHLATALWDGTVYLWHLPSGPPAAYVARIGGSTLPVLSPDRKLVLPRGISHRAGNLLQTRVYNADTGVPAGPMLDPGGILIDAAFSSDGTRVATASSTGRTPQERNMVLFESDGKGGNVQIWDWKSGKRLIGPIPTPSEPRGVTFRPDGSMLAVVCADYHILLVDPNTGKITRRLDPGVRSWPQNANQWMSNGEARFSPDGRYLVTWELSWEVHVWDPDTGQLLHTLPHNQRVQFVRFVPNSPEMLATAGWDSEARVWNLRTGELLPPLRHSHTVSQLLLSPDGKDLITGAYDGMLRTWDWRAAKLQDGRPLHARMIRDFRFTADQRWLVTVGIEELQVTDWATKIPASPAWNTRPYVTAAVEIPDGDRRAIVSGFSPFLVGYDLEALRSPSTDSLEELTALAELAAGRRVLSEGNIVPLNSAEWLERWHKVQRADIAALKPAADVDRQEAQAWLNLAITLHEREDLDAAIDAYAKSLALDGTNAALWHRLGLLRQGKQDWPGAADAFKKSLAVDPQNAPVHLNLGNALRQQRDFPAAVAAFRDAARLYAETLADQARPAPALAATRYQGSCAAILAAGGLGAGAERVPVQEKSDLRRQALGWLTVDLAARRKLLATSPVAAVVLHPTLEHWMEDPDLAGVRDGKGLSSLPPAEQDDWRKFWADVDSLVKEIRSSCTTTTQRGTLTAAQREQVHPLAVSAGKTYVIDMESHVLDSYLRLEDGQGRVLAENDDISADSLNARIVFSPRRDGTYRIVATSYQRRGVGEYALTIRTFARQKQ
jgi:WD40 repeat protein